MHVKAPYDLNALNDWDFEGTSLAVIGHPVAHSISPVMHNAALQYMAKKDSRFKDWHYFKFDIEPSQLAKALTRFHAKRFVGLNLTVPHKAAVLPLVKKMTTEAHRMGAINTLLWQPDGYIGHNTDGYGLELALKKTLGVKLQRMSVMLLGAGGAARAAAVQCLNAGCQSLWIGNRSLERLRALLKSFKDPIYAERLKSFSLARLPVGLPRTGVLINATTLGLKPNDPSPIDLSAFDPSLKVYDMIYQPPQTSLLRMARQYGMASANGLSMLVHQGARALSIWTQTKAPVDVMHEAAFCSLKEG